ncbi:fimbrial protein [Yersinia mollaretii]|uniref:fimbrial protein n=1 Tax=Yersinia mollaretii TaxID=33060 RepID=UPI0021BDD26A|nr:fimbrial protein [Yersinia mollaretii]
MFHFKSIKAKGFTRLSQLILICGGLVLLAPATAIAKLDCKLTSAPPTFSNFKVDQNAPINTAIHKESFRVSLSCSSSYDGFINVFDFKTLSGNSPTNLRGIELKYTIKSENFGCGLSTQTNGNININCRNTPDTSKHPYIFSYDVEFIKLDNNHEVGTINHYPDVVIKYYTRFNDGSNDGSNDNSGYIYNTITPNNNIQVLNKSCVVNTPNLNFDLGKPPQYLFTGIGSTEYRSERFIRLTCDPGARYFLQVDGNLEQGYPGVIKLIPESGAATGVGVRLFANTQVVEFGRAREMIEHVGANAGGQRKIKINAEYYQTAPRVTPGRANAEATFTITYQ